MIKDGPHLRFAGLLFYPPLNGWPHTQSFLDAVQAGLKHLGLKACIVSTGGTPNLKNIGRLNGATEHRELMVLLCLLEEKHKRLWLLL